MPSDSSATAAAGSGPNWLSRAATGSTSAAKFVPQRLAKRDGRDSPAQVRTSTRSSAARIARCSAPCRRSVRPRSSQTSSSAESAEPGGQLERAGKEEERERGQDRPDQEPALARAHDAATPDERRDRRTQPQEPAQERYVPERPRRRAHLALAQRTVHPCERPEALAHDHDPVRPGHAAEAGELPLAVRALERLQRDLAVHAPSIVQREPPGNCRAAYSVRFSVLRVSGYQRPREKNPSSASTRITIRMIQRRLNASPFLVGPWFGRSQL